MYSNFFKQCKAFILTIGLIVIVSLFNYGLTTHAAPDPGLGGDIGRQLNSAGNGMGVSEPVDPRVTIMYIIRSILRMLGIIVLCFIVYAGFLWLTAGGNESQIEKAKLVMRNSVIGLAIILSSYSITIFVIYLALGRPGTFWDRLFGAV